MTFWDDDRGASVQVGAIILFGFLILAIAGWQAQVVPQDNAEIEHTHRQRVTDDMQDVRNEIVSAPGETAMRSVAVEMAPEYPPRTLFVNPAQPSGTLRTVGTMDEGVNVTIENARANDGEEADYWNGSVHAYNTGGIVYEPGYNVYHRAPDTIYENSVLYNVHDAETNVTVTGQELIEGRTISLVTLNGSVDRSSAGVYTVDARVLSSSTRTVAVNNSSGTNITISFASLRAPSSWEQQLHDANEFVEDGEGGHVVDVRRGTPPGGQYHNVTIELEGDTTYRLRMAKVGVGSETERTTKAYVVGVQGNGSTVQPGNTKTLVVEVRDRYNNPVSGVPVENNTTGTDLNGGSLRGTGENNVTGNDGRVSFEFTGEYPGEATIVFNVSDDVTPANRELVRFTIDVTHGGGGGWDTYWDIDDSSIVGLTCDDNGSCTLDASVSSSVTLPMKTSTTTSDLRVEYAVNKSAVGTVSPVSGVTNSLGENSTTFTASANGTTPVYVASGATGDTVTITAENVGGGGGSPPVVEGDTTVTDQSTSGGGTTDVQYEADWNVSDVDGDLDTVKVYLNNSSGAVVDSETITISGSNAQGIDTLGEGDANSDNETCSGNGCKGYTVTVKVFDSAGRSDSQTYGPDKADGSGI